MKSGIYKITNIINNKIYIGSAVNFNKRWNAHRSELKLNKHHCKHLQNSYNKYNENCFIYEIIEIVDNINDLLIKEQYWIDLLKPDYNTSKIAGSSLGVKASKETKKKIGEANKKRIGNGISELMKAKALEANIGNKYNLGRILNSEHKIKISKNCKLSKIVLCLNTGIFYNSIKEAALSYNYNPKNLSKWLNGNFKNKSSLTFI